MLVLFLLGSGVTKSQIRSVGREEMRDKRLVFSQSPNDDRQHQPEWLSEAKHHSNLEVSERRSDLINLKLSFLLFSDCSAPCTLLFLICPRSISCSCNVIFSTTHKPVHSNNFFAKKVIFFLTKNNRNLYVILKLILLGIIYYDKLYNRKYEYIAF